MTQEIIGSEPLLSEIKVIFEKELLILIENLESISKENLDNLLLQQKIVKNMLTLDLVQWL